MANLISVTRARYNLDSQRISLSTNEITTLTSLIAAVSSALERYCRRSFGQASYDEYHHGNGSDGLLLDHYPILQVDRVVGGPRQVLQVQNQDPNVQRATVRRGSSGLTLTRESSGVTASDTVDFASYRTLAAVQEAIEGLGHGWTATLAPGDALRASVDLRAPQGALEGRGQPAALIMHTQPIRDYWIEAEKGILWRGDPLTLDCELDGPSGRCWSRGIFNYRVVYTAGYSTIPEDVQEACAEWVAQLYWQTRLNPGFAPTHPPLGVRLLLEPWRRYPL